MQQLTGSMLYTYRIPASCDVLIQECHAVGCKQDYTRHTKVVLTKMQLVVGAYLSQILCLKQML
jgi:hypothetical protein